MRNTFVLYEIIFFINIVISDFGTNVNMLPACIDYNPTRQKRFLIRTGV